MKCRISYHSFISQVTMNAIRPISDIHFPQFRNSPRIPSSPAGQRSVPASVRIQRSFRDLQGRSQRWRWMSTIHRQKRGWPRNSLQQNGWYDTGKCRVLLACLKWHVGHQWVLSAEREGVTQSEVLQPYSSRSLTLHVHGLPATVS